MLRDDLWVAVLIILWAQLLSVLYYRVEMDIVLSVQILYWAFIIPEILSLLFNANLFKARVFSRAAKCSVFLLFTISENSPQVT